MSALVSPAFAHRENRDGSTDSICLKCFVTACTSCKKDDLARAEKGHICDPIVLARWKKILEPGE